MSSIKIVTVTIYDIPVSGVAKATCNGQEIHALVPGTTKRSRIVLQMSIDGQQFIKDTCEGAYAHRGQSRDCIYAEIPRIGPVAIKLHLPAPYGGANASEEAQLRHFIIANTLARVVFSYALQLA